MRPYKRSVNIYMYTDSKGHGGKMLLNFMNTLLRTEINYACYFDNLPPPTSLYRCGTETGNCYNRSRLEDSLRKGGGHLEDVTFKN